MGHIQGMDRNQVLLFPEAVEDYIDEANPVRFIDAFVDSPDLKALGFEHAVTSETGRPPYHPVDLLKLYLYGYLNKIRFSRKLRVRHAFLTFEADWRRMLAWPESLESIFPGSLPSDLPGESVSADLWG